MEQEAQLSFLMEKRLSLLVEMATKKYDREILELKAQLHQLNGELETLRSNVKSIRVEQAQQPQQQAQPIHHEHQQAQQSRPVERVSDAQIAAASNAGESVSSRMARTGNYKSEDVSVEKFFYFGNKK